MERKEKKNECLVEENSGGKGRVNGKKIELGPTKNLSPPKLKRKQIGQIRWFKTTI